MISEYHKHDTVTPIEIYYFEPHIKSAWFEARNIDYKSIEYWNLEYQDSRSPFFDPQR